MSITVKYFASLRERLGREQDIVGYEDGLTVSGAWSRANAGEPIPDSLMIAVNMKYVKGDVELADGDEVAFFPAVTGG
ncbi:MAG: MoaD/ThiS family protein [Gammaproteobacteria bacterium]|jgi:molybdopterin synthase sulfur carrier subunit